MTTGTVMYERLGDIALVTLNDPSRRNALSREIVRGVSAALDRALEDGARAVAIAANGPAFCAGANIDDLRSGWMESPPPDEDPALMFKRIAEFERPVIAAVHGPAIGGGMELTLACDLVVASTTAWLSMPELGHGVIPNTGVALLSRIVGLRRAFDLILTRRRVPIEEALELGLVNCVVSSEELSDSVLSLAHQVVDTVPPGALRAAKLNLCAHAGIDWERVVSSPRDVPKEEWQEGLDAFTQKRNPNYARFWS
ncbi:enoyl-CoA hydratase/isomerase family protein [Caballeronia sp. EK]|uniref:enoyl-CoA hydratase/isomerase family protein n=1 Tax=unclassified Caballeronia TaxID=2646786 RepID=UPI0016560EBD|nr:MULTISPECIES: enoyl-CoA hydratase/isomerase family protein [unclassified Caballeronia]MBC8641348.1 enoyl-CoA hydratase/isomerase family protein [Caballeronia sp. EK]BCQ28644.1 enoyl-CoA hydratase/isomerase family protein [Caballeronia sp. NK8]